ncbi:hypothetical protein EDB85DRAFT_2273599 [Lactarius pseudohatsudake]|nr:hypothetical protein EDB85DRAFT_2273599 [Lactarius pseudohatsudake]
MCDIYDPIPHQLLLLIPPGNPRSLIASYTKLHLLPHGALLHPAPQPAYTWCSSEEIAVYVTKFRHLPFKKIIAIDLEALFRIFGFPPSVPTSRRSRCAKTAHVTLISSERAGPGPNLHNKQFTCPQSVQSGLNAEDAIRNGPPLVGVAPVLAAVLKRASPNKLESPACRHDKMSDTSDIRLEMYLSPTHRMMAPINAPAKSGKEDPVIVTAGAMRRNELSSTSSVTIIQYNLNSQRGRFPPGLVQRERHYAISGNARDVKAAVHNAAHAQRSVVLTKRRSMTPTKRLPVNMSWHKGARVKRQGIELVHKCGEMGKGRVNAKPERPTLLGDDEAQGWRQHAVQLQIRKMIPRLWSLQAAVYNDEELPLLEAWKQDDRTSDASAIARGKEGGLALTANLSRHYKLGALDETSQIELRGRDEKHPIERTRKYFRCGRLMGFYWPLGGRPFRKPYDKVWSVLPQPAKADREL